MFVYIKSHVRLYKILCSLVFFLTSIRFIRYKVTVTVLICIGVRAVLKINQFGQRWSCYSGKIILLGWLENGVW